MAMIKEKNFDKIKYFTINFLMVLFTIFSIGHASEYNIKQLEPNEVYEPNSSVHIVFELKNDDNKKFFEPFHCNLSYDENNLRYRKVNCKNTLKRRDIKIEKCNNLLKINFNPGKPREIQSENEISEMFDIEFTVKNKVLTQESTVRAEFNDSNQDNKDEVKNTILSIKGNPILENCKLSSLEISSGKISPEFSPNVFDYTAIVPSQTQYLDIKAIPARDDLFVKINKRKLSSENQVTDITVTVSNRSLRVKSVYNIKVSKDKNSKPEQLSIPKTENNNFKKSTSDTSNKPGQVSTGKISICGATKKSKKATGTSKRSHKTKRKSSSKFNGKSDNEEEDTDQNFEENLENESIYNENEENANEIFSNPNTYLIVGTIAILCAGGIYFIVKFLRSKKESDEDINNDTEK